MFTAQHDKFIAAMTDNHGSFWHGSFKASGHLNQHQISIMVSNAVVYVFKVVQIYECHTKRRGSFIYPGADVFLKIHSIWQFCKVVVHSLIQQLFGLSFFKRVDDIEKIIYNYEYKYK